MFIDTQTNKVKYCTKYAPDCYTSILKRLIDTDRRKVSVLSNTHRCQIKEFGDNYYKPSHKPKLLPNTEEILYPSPCTAEVLPKQRSTTSLERECPEYLKPARVQAGGITASSAEVQ